MRKCILILVSTLISFQASLVSGKEAGSGPNPFTDCGIGAALFPDTHWAAVTSNVIWDVGTTAVTSATASPETCSGKEVEVATFINHSYDNILEETAKGEGQYITAMLNMYGCNDSVQANLVSDVRKDLAVSLGEKNYHNQNHSEKVITFYQIVNSTVTGKYSDSCSA